MDLGIAGRRGAVAAGSAGLGYATAAALAQEGVAVAICGRDDQRLREATEALTELATGPPPVGILCDLSRAGEPERFVLEAADALGGPLDILVPNAGGPPPGQPLGTDLDAYRAAIELNFLATVAMCGAAVPAMVQAGWGRVVAITSVGARQPIGFLAASSTARAAVTSYLKTLSEQVASRGVTVNSVQPGSHATDRITSLSGERAEELRRSIPAGRLGDPGDFGRVTAFLCSESAGYVTGVGLPVDGGATRALQ